MKKSIIEKLIAQKSQLLASMEEELQTRKEASDLDESDTLDPEDYSNQDVNTELRNFTETHVAQLKKDISELNEVIQHRSDSVDYGSLVVTEKNMYLIGFGFNHLDNHSNVFGVGKGSRVYNDLLGKKIGDKFQVKEEEAIVMIH